jgi:hypothetical protein
MTAETKNAFFLVLLQSKQSRDGEKQFGLVLLRAKTFKVSLRTLSLGTIYCGWNYRHTF